MLAPLFAALALDGCPGGSDRAADVYPPSIVDIPAAGCWLLRLRSGKRAGVIVVRAVDARG